MTPLSILVVADVSPAAILGGAERALWEQARHLAAAGHAVRVVSRWRGPGPAESFDRDGVSVRHFEVRARSLFDFVSGSVAGARRAVSEELARTRADVVHLHQPLSALGVLTSPVGRRVSTLYTFHSPAPLEYRSRASMTPRHFPGWRGALVATLLWAIEGACVRRARQIHVLSRFSANVLWELYRVPRERVVVIPGGVDTQRFCPADDRVAARAALGLPAHRRVLFTVRNLERRMGLDILLQALATVRRGTPDVLLLVGGTGSMQQELRGLAHSLGLDEHVRWLGFIPEVDLPRYYRASDFFVLPTRELEGFGLVTLEALASGTPVIGTAVGATPEILEAVDPALIVPAPQAGPIAAAVVGWLDADRREPARVETLRRRCRQLVEDRYTWDSTVGALSHELARLASGSSPRRSVAACPACGMDTGEESVVYRGERYYRCQWCGTYALAAMPSRTDLHRRYDSEYPRRFAPARIAAERSAMLTSMLDRLGTSTRGARLLDVGCGGGHLAAAARARGWWTVGVDVSWPACVAARDLGLPTVQAEADALPFPDAAFDATTLVNVLDHTSAPLATVREAARVLRPAGLLAIRVPDGRLHATCARLLSRCGPLARRRGWDAYPILHLFGFGPRGLTRLLHRAGFDAVVARNSTVAADGAAGAARPRHVRLLAAGVQTAARLAALISGGRWLLGPSLEVYGRRRR